MRALFIIAAIGMALALVGCAGSRANTRGRAPPPSKTGAEAEKKGAVRTLGDRDKEVVCERAMPTGSHIMRTICFPRGWLRDEEHERRRDEHQPPAED